MWEGYYGKEPFDLRLTALRFLKNLDKIIVVTLAGTLIFGGGYYVKNVLLRGEVYYSAQSTYKVEYADPDWAQYGTYINDATWDTYVHTEEFLNMVQGHLREQESSWELTNQELSEALAAQLPTDLRVPQTIVTTVSPQMSLEIAEAVEQAMTEDFPQVTKEVDSIRVVDPAVSAQEVFLDVRPGRAFLLSALLTFFFAVVIFLLKETGEDSIWLPSSIKKRYGLLVLGTMGSPFLKENIRYLFAEKKRVGVCFAQDRGDPAAVASKLGECSQGIEWIPAPTPALCPEVCRTLREMDGILLAVPAGSHAGKPLEYTLEYLRQQDCEVTAAILWEADEKLIRAYYWLERGKDKSGEED